jgi:hypothetical protein
MDVADQRVDRLLGTLEASFQGAISHEEELAANDLATSLLQGRDAFDVVRAWGGATLEGRALDVAEIGSDYAGVGRPCREIIRLEEAVLSRGAGAGLICDRGRTFLEVLRAWARDHEEVQVQALDGGFQGRLLAAGPDHLLLETAAGQKLIGAAKVRSVKLSRGR